jgi:uncharacterized membrane-anchored protein YjiN (DUF445 family)
MSKDIQAVMQRWRENRYGEYDTTRAYDAINIADHACEVMPKLVEALEAICNVPDHPMRNKQKTLARDALALARKP